MRIAVSLAVAGCILAGAAYAADRSSNSSSVVLVTHESFLISKPVKAAFERQTGLKLRILQTGDAGAALNRAILTAGKPEGDAFFGVDNNLLTRALDGALLEPYTPPALDAGRSPVRPRPEPQTRPRRSRRGVPELRQAVVCRPPAGATDDTRRSRAPGIPQPPRRREPCHLDTWSRVSAGHRRPLRRERLEDYWQQAPGERGAVDGGLDRGVRAALLGCGR